MLATCYNSSVAFLPKTLPRKGFLYVRGERLKKTERWQSGRMRRFAKPLYGLTPVPRVRIPPSPPVLRSQSLTPLLHLLDCGALCSKGASWCPNGVRLRNLSFQLAKNPLDDFCRHTQS